MIHHHAVDMSEARYRPPRGWERVQVMAWKVSARLRAKAAAIWDVLRWAFGSPPWMH